MLPPIFPETLALLKNMAIVSIPASVGEEGPGDEVVKEAKTQLYLRYGFNYPPVLIS
jgi:hypothetical protein